MTPNATRTAIGIFLLVAVASASAVESTEHRFALQGNATVSRDKTPLTAGGFTVRGYLQPGAASQQASTQEGSRFALAGHLLAQTQVCYNDTIFRNDFDGDGG